MRVPTGKQQTEENERKKQESKITNEFSSWIITHTPFFSSIRNVVNSLQSVHLNMKSSWWHTFVWNPPLLQASDGWIYWSFFFYIYIIPCNNNNKNDRRWPLNLKMYITQQQYTKTKKEMKNFIIINNERRGEKSMLYKVIYTFTLE